MKIEFDKKINVGAMIAAVLAFIWFGWKLSLIIFLMEIRYNKY